MIQTEFSSVACIIYNVGNGHVEFIRKKSKNVLDIEGKGW